MPQYVHPLSDINEPRIAVYVRIASVLKTQILRGVLKQGQRVPGIDALCTQYGIARATARQVLQLLVSDGLISSERGRGSHVIYARSVQPASSEGMFQLVTPTPADHAIQILHREVVTALPAEMEVTEPVAEKYKHISKVHLQSGMPYGLYELYVDAEIYARFPRGADTREKIFMLMHFHAAIRDVRGRESLMVHPADWDEARHLGYQVGLPVVRLLRIMFDDSGKVVYAASNTYRGDRFRQDRTITGYFYGGDGELIRETSEAARPLDDLMRETTP